MSLALSGADAGHLVVAASRYVRYSRFIVGLASGGCRRGTSRRAPYWRWGI